MVRFRDSPSGAQEIASEYPFSYLDAVSPLTQRALENLQHSLVGQLVEPAELCGRVGQSLRLLGADRVFGLCLSGLTASLSKQTE